MSCLCAFKFKCTMYDRTCTLQHWTVHELLSYDEHWTQRQGKKEPPFNNKKGYSSYFSSVGIQPTNAKSLVGFCLLSTGRKGWRVVNIFRVTDSRSWGPLSNLMPPKGKVLCVYVGVCVFVGNSHGRRKFKDTNPLMSSLLVTLLVTPRSHKQSVYTVL